MDAAQKQRVRAGTGWAFAVMLPILALCVPMFLPNVTPDSWRDPRFAGSHTMLWFAGLLGGVLMHVSAFQRDWRATWRAVMLLAGVLIAGGGVLWALRPATGG